jgi:hypothetical protein
MPPWLAIWSRQSGAPRAGEEFEQIETLNPAQVVGIGVQIYSGSVCPYPNAGVPVVFNIDTIVDQLKSSFVIHGRHHPGAGRFLFHALER